MEPLKIILLVISHAEALAEEKIQLFAQKLEQLLLKENLGHIQNLILGGDQQEKIEKKIEQMTNTNCEVLLIANLSTLTNLPSNQFINHKLVLTITPEFSSEMLIETLRQHQKTVERSFGCKKGCL